MVKDSPQLTDVSADASNVDFFTANKNTFLLFLLPLLIYDSHLSIIQLHADDRNNTFNCRL